MCHGFALALQRPEAGQCDAGQRGAHKDRRLWHVQGEHLGRGDHQDLLRHSGLHRARGTRWRLRIRVQLPAAPCPGVTLLWAAFQLKQAPPGVHHQPAKFVPWALPVPTSPYGNGDAASASLLCCVLLPPQRAAHPHAVLSPCSGFFLSGGFSRVHPAGSSVLGMPRPAAGCSSLVPLLLEMTNPGAQLCPSLCVIEASSTT